MPVVTLAKLPGASLGSATHSRNAKRHPCTATLTLTSSHRTTEPRKPSSHSFTPTESSGAELRDCESLLAI